MARQGEQAIKCNVRNCRYNSDQARACTLGDIIVGQEAIGDAKRRADTVCGSFEAK